MVDIPPPRYQIIERDRRLVVIDRWGEQAPRGAEPVRPMSSRGLGTAAQTGPIAGTRRTSFDGRAELMTQRWYDEKAPRTLALDPDGAAMLGWARLAVAAVFLGFVVLAIFQPFTLVLPFFLLNPKARQRLRAGATALIDRLAARQG